MNKSPKAVRIPPQALESEMALLGGIMQSPDAIHEVNDLLTPDCFYADKHKAIFETMLELNGRGDPIDLISLSSRLSEKNLLDRVGGRSYLTELIQSIPPASNIRHYAELVKKKYTLRRLIQSAEQIGEMGFDEGTAIDELLDKAEKQIFDISQNSSTAKFVPIGSTLDEAWARLDRLHHSKDELRGVPTGFRDLDNMLSGFQKSDLIILAARPSMGKTSLALDIARQAAVMHNIPVGFFSLEMSSAQLVDRMLSSDSKVNAWKLRTGKLSIDHDFEKIRHSLDRLSKAPIYIDDQPGSNILKMRSVARKLKIEKGLGMIVVDYLQLIMPTSSKNSDNVVQQVTEISRGLKQLARELEVPVLALSQLNRSVETRGGDGRPKLSDLRDSGSIEQDADVVMFIHREDKYKENSDKKGIAQIHIDKHRNGAVGTVELYFDEERVTFLNLEKSNISDFMKEDNPVF
ncbi:MAG: replicative DNA helicase [Candidatus Paceibacterota bacterium]|jgi:replicative DNA helicase